MRRTATLILLAARVGLVLGDGSCGGGGGGGGSGGGGGGGGPPLAPEVPLKVRVTSRFEHDVDVFWDNHDDAVKNLATNPEGDHSTRIATMAPGKPWEFNINTGHTVYVRDDKGTPTSSITITPGVTEYDLEPGTLAQPPWGTHEALGKQMFDAFDSTERDELLSWEELSTLLEGPLAKKEGVSSPKGLFESMDTDTDGHLAWAEAKAFFVSIQMKGAHERARRWGEQQATKGKQELEGFKHLLQRDMF